MYRGEEEGGRGEVVFIFELVMAMEPEKEQQQCSNRTREDNGPASTRAGILIHSGDRHSPRQSDTMRHNTSLVNF